MTSKRLFWPETVHWLLPDRGSQSLERSAWFCCPVLRTDPEPDPPVGDLARLEVPWIPLPGCGCVPANALSSFQDAGHSISGPGDTSSDMCTPPQIDPVGPEGLICSSSGCLSEPMPAMASPKWTRSHQSPERSLDTSEDDPWYTIRVSCRNIFSLAYVHSPGHV